MENTNKIAEYVMKCNKIFICTLFSLYETCLTGC